MHVIDSAGIERETYGGSCGNHEHMEEVRQKIEEEYCE